MKSIFDIFEEKDIQVKEMTIFTSDGVKISEKNSLNEISWIMTFLIKSIEFNGKVEIRKFHFEDSENYSLKWGYEKVLKRLSEEKLISILEAKANSLKIHDSTLYHLYEIKDESKVSYGIGAFKEIQELYNSLTGYLIPINGNLINGFFIEKLKRVSLDQKPNNIFF